MEFTDLVPALPMGVGIDPTGTKIACLITKASSESMLVKKVAGGIVKRESPKVFLCIRDFGTLRVLAEVGIGATVHSLCVERIMWSPEGRFVALVSPHALSVFALKEDDSLALVLSIREPVCIEHAAFVIGPRLLLFTEAAVHIHPLSSGLEEGRRRMLPPATAFSGRTFYFPSAKALVTYNDSWTDYWVTSLKEEGCAPSYVGTDAFGRVFAVFASAPSPALAVMYLDPLIPSEASASSSAQKLARKRSWQRTFYRPRYAEDGALGLLGVGMSARWLAMIDGARCLHVLNVLTRSFSCGLSLTHVPPELVAYREYTAPTGKYEAVYARQLSALLCERERWEEASSAKPWNHQDGMLRLAWSPDQQHLAIASGAVVHVVRVSLLGTLAWATVLLQDAPVHSLQWHPAIDVTALFLTTTSGRNVFCWQPDGCRSLQIPANTFASTSSGAVHSSLQFRPGGIGELVLCTSSSATADQGNAGGFCLAFPDWLLPTSPAELENDNHSGDGAMKAVMAMKQLDVAS